MNQLRVFIIVVASSFLLNTGLLLTHTVLQRHPLLWAVTHPHQHASRGKQSMSWISFPPCQWGQVRLFSVCQKASAIAALYSQKKTWGWEGLTHTTAWIDSLTCIEFPVIIIYCFDFFDFICCPERLGVLGRRGCTKPSHEILGRKSKQQMCQNMSHVDVVTCDGRKSLKYGER